MSGKWLLHAYHAYSIHMIIYIVSCDVMPLSFSSPWGTCPSTQEEPAGGARKSKLRLTGALSRRWQRHTQHHTAHLSLSLSLSGVTARSRPMRTPQRNPPASISTTTPSTWPCTHGALGWAMLGRNLVDWRWPWWNPPACRRVWLEGVLVSVLGLCLFLFLACTCSFVLLLRVFASSESRSPPPIPTPLTPTPTPTPTPIPLLLYSFLPSSPSTTW